MWGDGAPSGDDSASFGATALSAGRAWDGTGQASACGSRRRFTPVDRHAVNPPMLQPASQPASHPPALIAADARTSTQDTARAAAAIAAAASLRSSHP